MSEPELEKLALDKLCAVLGPERGRALLEKLLAEGDFRVDTAQDLKRLGQMLKELGGFEGAIGGMLGVQAAIRGAR